jgi:hypothetical protein
MKSTNFPKRLAVWSAETWSGNVIQMNQWFAIVRDFRGNNLPCLPRSDVGFSEEMLRLPAVSRLLYICKDLLSEVLALCCLKSSRRGEESVAQRRSREVRILQRNLK